MKGRYAGVSMRLHTAMLPGAARLAGLPAEPSEEAKRRMTIIRWFEEHDRRVRLTARHFGFSPDTVSRWANAYQKWGAAALLQAPRTPLLVGVSPTADRIGTEAEVPCRQPNPPIVLLEPPDDCHPALGFLAWLCREPGQSRRPRQHRRV